MITRRHERARQAGLRSCPAFTATAGPEPTGQTAPNSPAFTPATNEANDAAEVFSTGPPGFFESRTGTTPSEPTRLAATSMHWPPFSLNEDLNQRGTRSSRGALS